MHDVKNLDDLIEQDIKARVMRINKYLPAEELLAQVAEKAAELGHAACKLRRALDKSNPTPVSIQEALRNYTEEVADVYLSIQAVGVDEDVVQEIRLEKSHRWLNRLRALYEKETENEFCQKDGQESQESGPDRG